MWISKVSTFRLLLVASTGLLPLAAIADTGKLQASDGVQHAGKSASLTGPIVPERVEISAVGVFVKTSLTGLTAPGCTSTQTYAYVHFPVADEVQSKFADRAMSSIYYAQSLGKQIRVVVGSCTAYAVATWIYIE